MSFKLYATGEWSLTELHEQMHQRGLRGRRGGRLTRSAFADMLKNPAYLGKVSWRGVVYEGKHEPIVPVEIFQAVQETLARNNKAGARESKHAHYLKGLLRCGECGSRLIYTIAKGRFPYYVCIGKAQRRTECSQSHNPVQKIEDQIVEIYGCITIPADLERNLEESLEREIAARESARAEATRFAAKRLGQLAGERDKLLRAYYADAINVETLKREQDRIDTETGILEAQMAGETIRLHEAKKIIKLALRLAKNCRASYQKGSPETRKLWNEAFLKRVEIRDGKVSRYTLAEPFSGLMSGSNKKLLVVLIGRSSNREFRANLRAFHQGE